MALAFAVGAKTASADSSVPSPDKAQLSWAVPISQDWAADGPQSSLWVTQMFTGGMPIANMPHLTSRSGKDGQICAEVDAACLPDSSWLASGLGFLKLCSESPVAPCLNGVHFQDASGNWISAVLDHKTDMSAPAGQAASWIQPWGEPGTKIKGFQTQWGWKAQTTGAIPGSESGPMVFRFPGRPNAAGTETYALDATFALDISKGADGTLSSNIVDFHTQVAPVKVVDCTSGNMSVTVALESPSGQVNFGQTGGSCIDPALYQAQKEAGFATKFADKLPIRVDMQLPKNLGGWYQGRLDKPDVTVRSVSSSVDQVIITGSPIEVPTTSKALSLSDSKNAKFLDSPEFSWAKDAAKNGVLGATGPLWEPAQGLHPFDLWAPQLDKKARGSASLWTAQHFNSSARCMNGTDGFQGLVTTNSMVYQPETPTYSGGFLTYRVGGVHYDSTGKVQQGTYNFIMKHSVAQCLYGFTDAPISGTVEVTSSDGQENVAFTNVSDKDGWLKLTAEGFTFSSPTIKAKLTQWKLAPKLTTITCVKGKTVKKVTAVSPKCPAGYKKK